MKSYCEMVHVCDPSNLGGQRQPDICEFEASQVYKWVQDSQVHTKRSCLQKNKNKQQQQQKKTIVETATSFTGINLPGACIFFLIFRWKFWSS